MRKALQSLLILLFWLGIWQAASMLIEEIEAPADKKPSLQHLAFKGSMTERESG